MTKSAFEIDGTTIEFELFGQAPVQALGRLGTREFYFRARHQHWEFEVALEDGQLGSDLGREPVFLQRGQEPNAGYMTQERACELIRQCVQAYPAPSSGA